MIIWRTVLPEQAASAVSFLHLTLATKVASVYLNVLEEYQPLRRSGPTLRVAQAELQGRAYLTLKRAGLSAVG